MHRPVTRSMAKSTTAPPTDKPIAKGVRRVAAPSRKNNNGQGDKDKDTEFVPVPPRNGQGAEQAAAGKIDPKSPKPSTSKEKKKVRTKTKTKLPSNYAGRQPRLFEDSTSEDEAPVVVARRPARPSATTVIASANGRDMKNNKTPVKLTSAPVLKTTSQATENKNVLRDCTVSISPLNVTFPVAPRAPPTTTTGTDVKKPLPVPALQSAKKIELPPPPPPTRSKAKQVVAKEALPKKENVIHSDVENVIHSDVENSQNQAPSGRSLRPRGVDKKVITATSAFAVAELRTVDPHVFASQCRLVAVHSQEIFQQLKSSDDRFSKMGEDLLTNFENSIRKLREKKKQQAVGVKNVEPALIPINVETILDTTETESEDEDEIQELSTVKTGPVHNTIAQNLKPNVDKKSVKSLSPKHVQLSPRRSRSKSTVETSANEEVPIKTAQKLKTSDAAKPITTLSPKTAQLPPQKSRIQSATTVIISSNGNRNSNNLGKASESKSTKSASLSKNPTSKCKSLKRLRAQSSDDEMEVVEEENFNSSADMFEEQDDKVFDSARNPINKITFDFMAASELESVPVQAFKKLILDPVGRTVDVSKISENRRSERLSNREAIQSISSEGQRKSSQSKPAKSPRSSNSNPAINGATIIISKDEDEDDVFVDVLDNSIMFLEEDLEPCEPTKPPAKANVGELFAPDETYLLDPHATFIKDSASQFPKKTTPLNETVSVPASAFGNHIPQFSEFNISRHQLSTLDVLEEEEDADSPSAIRSKPFLEAAIKRDENTHKKTSTSSSSSNSSYKSAVSHLQPKKVVPVMVANVKKLDQIKKKEEDAQRNKAENLKRKQELQKKKNEEWKQKADKIKQEQEKFSVLKKMPPIPIPSTVTTGVTANKPFFFNKPTKAPGPPPVTQNFGQAGVNRILDNVAVGGFKASGPMKSYIKQGQLSKVVPMFAPPTSSYARTTTPVKSVHGDFPVSADVFKTPANPSASVSFLDVTGGPANSYDITLYEDLDDDLKHRENKVVPDWATNNTEIAILLFKQLGTGTVAGVGFPFPSVKKGYRLFDGPRH